MNSEMTFLNLGANVGLYIFLTQSNINEKGRIFALESYLLNAELIKASIKKNHDLTIVEDAISDKDGRASLFLSPDESPGNNHLKLNLQKASQLMTLYFPFTLKKVRRYKDRFR